MQLLGIVFSFLLCAALSSCRPRPTFHWENINYVYSFGDSYSYVRGTMGNPLSAFFCGAPELAFTPDELFANEIMPKNTSSDGQNYLEFLTGCTEGKPSNCRTQLWDFAHGGATITSETIPPRRNTTVQMNDQVRQWRDYASKYLQRPHGRTLTTWWIGINDCTRIFTNETILDHEAYIEADLDAYFRLIKSAAQEGLDTHLILTVPPIDRSPYAFTLPNGPKGLKKVIDMYNKKLSRGVAEYAKAHPEQRVMLFDAAAVFKRILDHPARYGFTDVSSFCDACENKRQYFWHNDEHPTEGVHRILASEIEEFFSKHRA